MDRVFLDANVLFSVAYTPASRLRTLWSLRDVELITSLYAAEEARRNLRAHRPSAVQDLEDLLAQIRLVAGVPADIPGGIELPEKDLPIIVAAAAARCTHLLTGDSRHFGAYYGKDILGVTVLTPAQYLQNRMDRA